MGRRKQRALRPAPFIAGRRAWLLLTALGCSSFDGGSDVLLEAQFAAETQPNTPGSDWSCLGAPPSAAPLALVESQKRVILSVQLVDLTTRLVPRTVRSRACTLTDVECTQPASDWVLADDQGWVDLMLFEGFVGYIESVGEGYVSGAMYLNDALDDSMTVDYPVAMISTDSLAALAGLLQVPLDPMSGMIAIRAFDCQGVTAPGVSLQKPGAGVPWFFADGLPTVSVDRTGDDGFGGFVNVPPGLVQVDAQSPTGASISGPNSFVVRPGWFSSAFVAPPGRRPRAGAR